MLIQACSLSEVSSFDIANGGFAQLAASAVVVPTLIALRVALLFPVLMYLSDAGRMHLEFAATGRISPGIELW